MKITTHLVAAMALGAIGCGSVSGDNPDAANDIDKRPIVTSLSPGNGPAGGGITMTVTGTGLAAGAANVVFGGRQAGAVTVVSDTELTFTLPAGEPGATVMLSVFNDDGFANLLQAFTYNQAAVIAGVEPNHGPMTGGTAITITGEGFAAGVAAVNVGGQAATDVAVVDDNTITATVPAGSGTAAVWTSIEVDAANTAPALEEGFRYLRPGLIIGRNGRHDGDVENATTLYYYDLVTNELVVLSTVGMGIRSLATHPDGTIYASINNRGVYGSLATVDPFTGELTLKTSIADAGDLISGPQDMAFSGAQLYGVRRDTSRLIAIDGTTGVVATVSTASQNWGHGPRGLATRDVDTFYFVNNHTGEVSLLDKATGTLQSPVTITGGTGSHCAGLAYVGGVLYSLSYRSGNQELLAINPATGVATQLALFPPGFYLKGLTTTPPAWN